MDNGVVLSLLFLVAFVAGDEGSDFLDSKEQELEAIVNLTLINAAKQCELLATCGGPANCSHDACSLEHPGSVECVAVLNNQYCPIEGPNHTCKSINLDFSRSYIRLAESTKLDSVETQLTICSQRALDPLFMELNKGRDLWRAYFAGMDGSYRIFPGLPKDETECRKFDPRVQPWFRTATSAAKIVVILIDIAASMGNNLSPDLGTGTIINAAKKMVTQLLKTLSPQDYVNIILFDSSRVIQLSSLPVQVQEHNGTAAPELEIFGTELNNHNVEEQHRSSDLASALTEAQLNFNANENAAKVIIILSDLEFADSQANISQPSVELYNSNVKIFMYKLKQPSDRNTFQEENALIKQVCAIGGHFEVVLKNLDNPLLVFQEYFTYLANLKKDLTKGKPHYSQVYLDPDAMWGENIITVSKPVFHEGDLIGVVGMTIYKDTFSGSNASLDAALRSRNTGYAPTGPNVFITSQNCSIVNETKQACGSSIPSASGVLCKSTTSPKTMRELMCCSPACIGRVPPPKSPLPQWVIPCSVTVGVLAVLLALGLVFYRVRRGDGCAGPGYKSDEAPTLGPIGGSNIIRND